MNAIPRIAAALARSASGFASGIIPPRRWRVPVILATATFGGLGLAALHIGNATSYLSDDPKACINCHIMAPQYESWPRSSHGRVTTCNDCHVPHDAIARKYAFKAMDGTRHASMFTLHMELQVIRMHEPGQRVVQENCQRCHDPLISGSPTLQSAPEVCRAEGRLCWDCHREIPHGRGNSLSSVSDTPTPVPFPVAPGWILDLIDTPAHLHDTPGANPTPTPAP